jgi:Flp pilus assembly protein TadB
MRLPTLFKQNKNKTFGYKPRHYDERKERLERLHEKHHGAKDATSIKGSFKRRASFRDDWKTVTKEKDQKQSQGRLIVIFLLLVAVAFLILDKYNIKLF